MIRIEKNFPFNALHFPTQFPIAVDQFLNSVFHSKVDIKTQLTSFSNRNFKIQDASGRLWVLRIPNDLSHRLCDQKQERIVLDWANREGFSLLQVHGYHEQEGYLLTPFLSGSSCCAADFQTPLILQEAIDLLHRVHTSNTAPITAAFDPLERYIATSEKAQQEAIILPEELHELAQHLKSCHSKIPSASFQQAPCHNDPSPENFFQHNGHLYLHDWELARINDPMWDLAHLSVIGRIDLEAILALYPTSDPLAREKIILFQAFVLFNTTVWASFERENPSSSVQKELAEKLFPTFLEQTNALIKSNPFNTALTKLIMEPTV